jgi:hypothetical protein
MSKKQFKKGTLRLVPRALTSIVTQGSHIPTALDNNLGEGAWEALIDACKKADDNRNLAEKLVTDYTERNTSGDSFLDLSDLAQYVINETRRELKNNKFNGWISGNNNSVEPKDVDKVMFGCGNVFDNEYYGKWSWDDGLSNNASIVRYTLKK